ncbi:MAG TPA: DoxX family protein [Gemmatimonadaceae bacterium]|jgi:putative oxidoreductase
MNGTTAVAPQRMALGLTLLRVVVGIVFLSHGMQKLFVFGLAGTTTAFSQYGVPLPGIVAPLVTFVEFLGGIALILGLFSRVAAVLLAIDMLGAIVFVHGKNGFFLPMGFEFALTLLVANIALAIGGPGEYAIENRFMKRGP